MTQVTVPEIDESMTARLVDALARTALTRPELCARLACDGPTFDQLADHAMSVGMVGHNQWGLYFLPNR